VVTVARTPYAKGVDAAIDAAQGACGASMTVVGAMPESFCARYPGVGFRGHLDRAALACELAAADVFVLPTLADNMPRAVLEALATGLPVITTPESGYEGVITDGVEGFIVPVGDVEAIADRLRLLAGDGAWRQRMSAAAREVAERHSWAGFEGRVGSLVARVQFPLPHRIGAGQLGARRVSMAQSSPSMPESDIAALDARFSFGRDERVVTRLIDNVRAKGALSKNDLLTVVEWKSPRATRFVRAVDERLITEATRISLMANNEELRIGGLTLIPGVGFPIASVVLHFFHEERYPIIDFRALWSLGLPNAPPYSFRRWYDYVVRCREMAARCGVSMRVLDRALWQYSKENQSRR
jgi:Glycosyl transferases group 1